MNPKYGARTDREGLAMAVHGSVRGTPTNRAVNIGPVLSQRLRDAGVETLEQLKEVGSVHAWTLIAEQTPPEERIHTLLALEGAIRSIRWTAISQTERHRLMKAAGLL